MKKVRSATKCRTIEKTKKPEKKRKQMSMVVNMSNRADARNLSRESRTLGHKRIVHAL